MVGTWYFHNCGPGFVDLRSHSLCSVMHSQSYPTLWDAMNCSPPHSSLHGIFQVRILQWLAFPTPTTDRFLLNALIKVGSGWWLDGTAYFADMAGKFFIHIPPLSLQISFVWLHPLESMGKRPGNAGYQGQPQAHRSGVKGRQQTRKGGEYLAQV